jgi:predicted nucleic acid-binding protein
VATDLSGPLPVEQCPVVLGHRGEVLPYDGGAARVYAALQEQRRSVGRPLSVEDGMIAAICVRAGATLATRNVRDFASLGLDLVDPWAGATEP